MKIISFKRLDHCVKCKTDRMVEMYDVRNKPLNYSYLLDNIDKLGLECFDKREVSYMKCKKCGAEYEILWQNGMPEPCINSNALFMFLNSTFKKYK